MSREGDGPRLTSAIARRRLVAALVAVSCLVPPPYVWAQPGARAEVPKLVAALKDADPLAREAAAQALGRIGPAAEAAVEPLVAAFSDEDLHLRGAAAVALGRIGSAAVPTLVRALEDPSAEVRWSAAIALGRVGPAGRAAIPALITAVADTSENVRYVAAVALGDLGSAAAEAVPALVEAQHDRDGYVRAAARRALQQIAPDAVAKRPDRPSAIARVDRLVPALMAELHVPGVSIALIEDRQVVWSNVYGVKNASTKEPVTKDTAFEAASMSKPIFGLLVMQLVEQHRFDLDRPLVEYGEELFVPDQAERRLVTARMALLHTSGFPNWRPGGEEREGPLPLLFTPGSRYSYSGEGIFYLQRSVERITGQPLDRWADNHLFQPLRIAHSSYAWTPGIEALLATGHKDDGSVLTKSKYTHPNAAYTLYTTAEDYARLLAEMMKAERQGSTLVTAKSIREMLRHQLRVDSQDPVERPGSAGGTAVYRGLGWSITATAQGDFAHHSGSNGTGFRCFSQFSPARGTGIVILTNGTRGGDLWTRLVASVGDF
jgi:CubicO group peptidase (beta-lactamase class C family)